MIKTFKGTHKDNFEALRAAEKWLEENGFSIAPLCGFYPVGVMKGEHCIAKWRNLTRAEIERLHGTMTSENFRNADVVVEIKDKYMLTTEGGA